MTTKSQRELILKHLLRGGKITCFQATQREFGFCMRLSERIREIERGVGHPMQPRPIIVHDRNHKTESGKRVTLYWMW